MPCDLGEQLEVDLEFRFVERDVHDLKAAQSRGPVDAIARMPANRLSGAHDRVDADAVKDPDKVLSDWVVASYRGGAIKL